MSEYIDRQEALDALIKEFENDPNPRTELRALFAIKDITAAEADEVVRCKDCKRYGTENCFLKIRMIWELRPDDYCSYAEAKDE